jgi:hypothetical protein
MTDISPESEGQGQLTGPIRFDYKILALGLFPTDFSDPNLFGTKDPITRISWTMQDISMVVEFAIDHCGENLSIGMSFCECMDVLGCSHTADETDWFVLEVRPR